MSLWALIWKHRRERRLLVQRSGELDANENNWI